MPVSSKQLLDFLREIGNTLDQRVILVAVGGTALTLYRVKVSTIDADFTGPARDVEFRNFAPRSHVLTCPLMNMPMSTAADSA